MDHGNNVVSSFIIKSMSYLRAQIRCRKGLRV